MVSGHGSTPGRTPTYHQPVLDTRDFPGQDLFASGVADLEAGEETEASLLVSLARTRLLQAGLEVPATRAVRPAHDLYDLLAARHGDAAHTRYNALLRRIASFARAAEHAASR